MEITSTYTLYNLFARHFTSEIQNDTGISLAGWCIVDSVAHAPGVIARRLGDYWSLDKTLLSRTLFELEESGFLERRLIAGDRRVHSLYLTPKGQKLHKALKVKKDEVVAALTQAIEPAELQSFYATSNKLASYLRSFLAEHDAVRRSRN